MLDSIDRSSSWIDLKGSDSIIDFRGHIIRRDYIEDEKKFLFSTDGDLVLSVVVMDDIKHECSVSMFDKYGNVIAKEMSRLLER